MVCMYVCTYGMRMHLLQVESYYVGTNYNVHDNLNPIQVALWTNEHPVKTTSRATNTYVCNYMYVTP